MFTCKILGLILNTLAAVEKYRVLNRDNLKIPIQMQLSVKQKAIAPFFAAFLKSKLNFVHFEKKDDRNYCILYVLYFRNYGPE